MTERKDEPGPRRPASSTLRHVKNVQQSVDVEVHWNNLHAKIQRWVEEAMRGQNLPPDKSLDDLAQEVLMQICKDIGEFKADEEGASFSGWVKMVANRKLMDIWRRARADKRGKGKTRHLGDFDEDGGREHFADERTHRPSVFVRYDELSRSMQEAMKELGEKHRRVIELRLFQGKAYSEMLEDLGYTKEVTVRSLYMRAMQELQELLRKFAD